MPAKKSAAKKNAAPRSEAPRPSPEEKRAKAFVEKVKRLHTWPDVGIETWREIFLQDHGVVLKRGDMEYTKVATAIKNAKRSRTAVGDPAALEQQAAVEALAGQPDELTKQTLAALNIKYKALLKERDALQQSLGEAETFLAAERVRRFAAEEKAK